MRTVNLSLACYVVVFLFSGLFSTPIVEEVVIITVEEEFVTIEIIEEEVLEKPVIEIPLNRVSAYNPVPRQTWGDPNVSSCGPNLERQIAVSRDLFFDEYGNKYLCGTVVTLITERGEVFDNYVIWDTMHPRYTNTADILIPTPDESLAFAFGVSRGTLILHVD
jgi:hypothetical protein